MPNEDLSFERLAAILKGEEDDSNRRKRRDWIARMPVVLSLLSWAILATVWYLLDYAAPPRSYLLWESFFNYYAPNAPWPRVPVNVAHIMLIVGMVLCVIAILFNRMRMRRKGDKYKVSVFLIGSITLITFVIFLVYFLPKNIIGYW